MTSNNAADTYLASAVETAPPVKILRMLYEGAIRFLLKAKACETASREQVEWIRKSEDIISELRVTLDHTVNAEVAASLDGLYGFCLDELGDAIIQRDPSHIDAAQDVLMTLLDAWKQVQIEGAEA
jgi:flagellar secretion chaperone FliS